MYPELKLLGLRPVAKAVGFQKPCPVASSRSGPRGPMRSQDRLAHHEGVVPHKTGSGRSVARTCRLSRLNLSSTATSSPTLFPARRPQHTDTMIGVSTHDGVSSLGRTLSCCSTNRSGGQLWAKADSRGALPPKRQRLGFRP
jgi:hypothetical protein